MGKGRVTIPTDLDVVPQTLEMIEEWGADAIRDCDGTEFPQKLKDTGAKIYATYYTTRKDNAWAKAHPEEIQQMYIMTSFHTPYKMFFHPMGFQFNLICDIIFNGLDDIFTNISSIHMAYLLRIGIDKYFAGNVILLNL